MPGIFERYEAARKAAADGIAGPTRDAPSAKPADGRSNISRGLSAGVDQTQGLGYGALGALGDIGERIGVPGSDRLTEFGIEGYQRNQDEAAESAPDVAAFSDIGSTGNGLIDDALSWSLYEIGRAVPTLATVIGTGGITGAVGQAAARKAASTVLEKQIKRKSAELMAKGISERAAVKGATMALTRSAAKAGGIAGFTAPNIALSTGGITGKILDETGQMEGPTALAFGAVSGLLDTVPLLAIAKRSGIPADQVKEGIWNRVSKEALKGMRDEGATEFAQTLIEAAAVDYVQDNLGAFTVADLKEAGNAAASGMLIGGLLGAGSGIKSGMSVDPSADVNAEVEALDAELDEPNGADVADVVVKRAEEATSSQAEKLEEQAKAALVSGDQNGYAGARSEITDLYERLGSLRTRAENAKLKAAKDEAESTDNDASDTALESKGDDTPAKADPVSGELVDRSTEVVPQVATNRVPIAKGVTYDGESEVVAGDGKPWRTERAAARALRDDLALTHSIAPAAEGSGFVLAPRADEEQKPHPDDMPGSLFGNTIKLITELARNTKGHDLIPSRETLAVEDYSSIEDAIFMYRDSLEENPQSYDNLSDDDLRRYLIREASKHDLIYPFEPEATGKSVSVSSAPDAKGGRNVRPDDFYKIAEQRESDAEKAGPAEREILLQEARIARERGDSLSVVDIVPKNNEATPTLADRANEAATSPTNDSPEPTQAQKEAGNYRVGKIRLGGLDVSIENPKGSERKGVDPSGKPWSVKMKSHYGYVKGSKAIDGDAVDVFLSDDAENTSLPVYIIDQIDEKGDYDEPKVMIGYTSRQKAEDAYLSNYAKGWTGLGAITPMSMEDFKRWVRSDDSKKPASGALSIPSRKRNDDSPGRDDERNKGKQPAAGGNPVLPVEGGKQRRIEAPVSGGPESGSGNADSDDQSSIDEKESLATESDSNSRRARKRRRQVEKVARKVSRAWPSGPKITVTDTIAEVPGVDKSLHNDKGIKGAYVNSRSEVFLVADALDGDIDVERTLLHEVQHFANRNTFGLEAARKLSELGETVSREFGSIESYVRSRNIDYDYSWYDEQFASAGLNRAQANAEHVDELLAHMASDKASASGRIRAKARSAIAAIRSWLRDRGFTLASSLPDDALVEMINRTQKVLNDSAQADARPINLIDTGSLRVWHGSPYKFDKFDMSKVDSGEGTQDEGYGLYFTSQKNVAEWYREQYEGIKIGAESYFGGEFKGSKEERIKAALAKDVWVEARASKSSLEEAANKVKRKIKEKINIAKKEKYSTYKEHIAALESNIALMDSSEFSPSPSRPGAVYAATIAPSQDQFLDFDKPIGEQSDFVKKALTDANYGISGETETGRDFYSRIVDEISFYEEISEKDAQRQASTALLLFGIRGNTYDRDDVGGARNYVVFDDRDIVIEAMLRRSGRSSMREKEGGSARTNVMFSRPSGGRGPTGDNRISTRLPTAKKAKEDAIKENLIVGMDAMRASEKAFETNVKLVSGYTNYRPVKSANTTEKKADRFVKLVVDNLLWLHDQVPSEIRSRSKLWYDGARAITDRFSKRYDLPDRAVAGAFAALSPQKDWYQNVSLAERVLEVVTQHKSTRWDEAMTETANRIYGKPQYRELIGSIKGKTYGDLDMIAQKAAWVRAYDETYNTRNYRMVSSEGEFIDWATNADGVTRSKVGWGSNSEIGKAIGVIEDSSIENVSAAMGLQHKVRNFYNNIIAPGAEHGDVTIDTHAVAAGLLQPLAGGSTQVLHNFGGTGAGSSSNVGVSGTYPIYADAYRRAAAERGILAREMQSITWEAVRGLFAPTFKSQSKNVKLVDDLWAKHKNGRASLDATRAAVLEAAGGITNPTWWNEDERSDGGMARIPEDSSYKGELPGDSVPGRTPRGMDGGAGDAAAREDSRPRERSDESSPSFSRPRPRAREPELARPPEDSYGRNAGRHLEGLPQSVAVDGKQVRFTGLKVAESAARSYMAKAGLSYQPIESYEPVDKDRAKRIANAFDEMAHDPSDPDVAASYRAMIDETYAQYQSMLDAGITIEFNDGGDPYGNPRNAILDVVENNHLYVFSTREGFGTDATFDKSDNPLLEVSPFQFGGQEALANDVFRAVHDFYGHIKNGVGFRARGEENAWRSHATMYSPLARRAATTETRGQNSWLNFGPHGDTNQTAGIEDTFFADQKIGLLPDWAMEDNVIDFDAIDAANPLDRPAFSRAPPVDTPAFKRWFGKSKVVDAKGNPLVVYHGSGNVDDIKSRQFDPALSGKGNDQYGSGFYFTTDKAEAKKYETSVATSANRSEKLGGTESPGTIDAYLSIQNPIEIQGNSLLDAPIDLTQGQARDIIKRAPNLHDVDETPIGNFHDVWEDGVKEWMIDDAAKSYVGSSLMSLEGDFFSGDSAAFREAVRETLGHDGVVQTFEDGKKHYVAWFPNQVKSARENSGAFDPDEMSIMFSRPADTIKSMSSASKRLRDFAMPKVRRAARRWFTKEGLTNDATFLRKISKDSLMNVGESETAALVHDLEKAITESSGSRYYNSAPDEIKAQVSRYLSAREEDKDEASDGMDSRVMEVADVLRANLDLLSSEVIRMQKELIELDVSRLTPDDKERMDWFFETGGAEGAMPPGIEKKLGAWLTIKGNMGSYLNRSYQAFDDEKWKDKALKDKKLVSRAEDYIRENNPKLTEEEVTGSVRAILQAAKKKGNFTSFMASGVKQGSKDVTILKKRKDVPPIIRELLGEYSDPRVNYTRSATKMQYLVANHDFLMGVRADGMGSWLHDKPTGEFDDLIAAKDSENYSPLDGLYTTEDYRVGMEDAMAGFEGSELMRNLIRVNSAVKYGKVVLSPATQMRNIQSAFMFMVQNGHFDFRHVSTGVKAGWSDLITKDEKWRAYLDDLIGLGVLHDSPNAGELRDAIRDFTDAERYGDGVRSTGKRALDFMTRMYQLGDDVIKVAGFENEMALALDAGMSRKDAREQAAYRIRNGYPTYSMVPKAIQTVRRWPLVGAFTSFAYESVRTSYNQIGFIREDLARGHKKSAARRIIGMSAATASAYAISKMSMLAMGMSDEDDEAVKSLMPPWSKNSRLLYLGYSKDGLPLYYDLSYMDPVDYWKRPLRALINGNNVGIDKKIMDSGKEALAPFFGPDIAAGALFEILSNKRMSGGDVYNESDSPGRQAMSIFNHARIAIQPGFMSNLERTALAASGEVSKSGKEYTLPNEGLAWLGHRISALNVPQSLIYKSYEFNDRVRDASAIVSRVAGSQQSMSDSEIKAAVDSMNRARKKAYTDLHRLTQASQRLGLSATQMIQAMKVANISEANRDAIRRGEVPPYELSSRFTQSAEERAVISATNIERRAELRAEMARRRKLVERLIAESS